MLSQVTFSIIDQRLRQASGISREYFGGISVILTGDPGQLLPVGGMPFYNEDTKNLLQSKIFYFN